MIVELSFDTADVRESLPENGEVVGSCRDNGELVPTDEYGVIGLEDSITKRDECLAKFDVPRPAALFGAV